MNRKLFFVANDSILSLPKEKSETIEKNKIAAQRKIIEQKVLNLIYEKLGTNRSVVTINSRFVEDLGADSLDLVELSMSAEEEFAIDIPDEDLEYIRTVKEAIDYIETKFVLVE